MTRLALLACACGIAIAAAAVGAGAGSLWARSRPVGAAGLRGGDPVYYVDPMHPAYRSDGPGTAPDCGMPLVPVFDTEGDPDSSARRDGRRVVADAAQQQLMGARLLTVTRQPARHDVRLFARVVADETRVYRVNVGIDGFIRELSGVTTGSQVSKGQWLATFSAPEARTALQGYAVAVDAAARARSAGDGSGQLDAASAGIQQAEDRLLNIGMSRRQIETLGRTLRAPAAIEVASPADGIVLERRISAGERFERGAELFRIADLRRIWIDADLFGLAADYIQPDAAARVKVPGRGALLPARVSRSTLPEFDTATQSLRVRFEADNPGLVLRPGMFVDVTLPIDLPAAISVPLDAVIDAGLETRVFVERTATVFEPRTVETGWRFGGRVEIRKGLEPGDRVVISGTFLFDSESRMRQTRAQSPGPR